MEVVLEKGLWIRGQNIVVSGQKRARGKGHGAKSKNPMLHALYSMLYALCILLTTHHSPLTTVVHAAELHGFLQGNYSYRLSDTACSGGPCDEDWLIIEERFQLHPSYEDPSGRLDLRAKIDLLHDGAIKGDWDVDVREVYLTLRSERFDLRIGRQIITWGLGDLVFINDVFPKDWGAFIMGRPLEYLKRGIDGAKVGVYSGVVNGELVIIPTFEPDTLPDSKRLLYFDPLPWVTNRNIDKPASKPSNTEIALRLYRPIYGFDTSLFVYRGFYRTPSSPGDSTLTRIDYFYPRLRVYGASTQGSILGGVLSLEAGYYDSEDDGGTDPEVENSQIRYLIGFQKAFGGDTTLHIQYYVERMMEYEDYRSTLPQGLPARDKTRGLYSVRLTQLLRHQTLRLSCFAFYSPTDRDYYLNPEVRYSITDNLWAIIGGNIFGGKEGHTSLGQYKKDDNIYLTMRYEF